MNIIKNVQKMIGLLFVISNNKQQNSKAAKQQNSKAAKQLKKGQVSQITR